MKPEIEEFKKVSNALRGNITIISRYFEVTRAAVYKWLKSSEEFRTVIDDCRSALFDDCIENARLLALGIPEINADGKFIGWKERPDAGMLIFFMSKLGSNEGFGKPSKSRKDNVQLVFSDVRVLTKPEYKELLDLENKSQNHGQNE